MKKLITLFAFAGLTVFMANCSSSKSASTASNEMTPEAKVAAVKKNFTAHQMEEGKTLFENNCNKCHGLKDPAKRTVEKLEKVLPSMIRKAKLTEEQGTLVRAYLLSQAKLS